MSSIPRRLFLISAIGLAMGTAMSGAGAQLISQTVGNGRITSESRTPGAFSAVMAAGAVDIVVRQGDADRVDIKTDENLLPLLETVVEERRGNRTLVVRWKRGESVRTRHKVEVVVTAIRLSAIAIDGAGDVIVEKMDSPQLALAISGAGDMKAQGLRSDDLKVSIAGSGDLQAAGQAARVQISVAGSGDVNTLALAADEVKVKIAGSGDVAVQANKTLDASIAGSGDVSYTGNPTVRKSVAGSGEVRKR